MFSDYGTTQMQDNVRTHLACVLDMSRVWWKRMWQLFKSCCSFIVSFLARTDASRGHSRHVLRMFWTCLARISDVCKYYLGAELYCRSTTEQYKYFTWLDLFHNKIIYEVRLVFLTTYSILSYTRQPITSFLISHVAVVVSESKNHIVLIILAVSWLGSLVKYNT